MEGLSSNNGLVELITIGLVAVEYLCDKSVVVCGVVQVVCRSSVITRSKSVLSLFHHGLYRWRLVPHFQLHLTHALFTPFTCTPCDFSDPSQHWKDCAKFSALFAL